MVTLIQKTDELARLRSTQSGTLGFVPTMGNLHQGHLSLLERALSDCEVVYFSIFVNPKQFGPTEDFEKYPRTLEEDLKKIEIVAQRFSKPVVVYAPENPVEVFPAVAEQTISVAGLSSELEGKIRPGHFDGVATVVHRLFGLIKPQKAYFGLKDYQQFLVVRTMVNDLQLPIKVIGMPIVRESDGLAMSSRNQYLAPNERAASVILFKTLSTIKELISGKRDRIGQAQLFIQETLKDPHWDYLELRDSETLGREITQSTSMTLLAVYRLGSTRLLDNLQIPLGPI